MMVVSVSCHKASPLNLANAQWAHYSAPGLLEAGRGP